MDTCLGGRVVGLTELPALAVDRGDIDDAAPTTGQHAFDDLLGGIEQAGQVGADDGVPVLRRQFAKRGVTGDAGVVDQYGDGANLVLHVFECICS
ncbi:hypothetical protein D3C81_1565950 [compost metagenome]